MDEGVQVKVQPQFWKTAVDDDWSMMTGTKGDKTHREEGQIGGVREPIWGASH